MSQRTRPCLWTALPQSAPAPSNRFKHACCAHGGDIFLLGGRERHSLLRDFWRYNVVRNHWTQLDSSSDAAPEELEEHSMVAYQGYLFVFGGMIDSPYNEWKMPLWVFDTVNENWMYWKGKTAPSTKPVPFNRKGHSAVVFGSAMYIYGGYVDMKGTSQEFWKFEFDTMLWKLLDCSEGEAGPGPRHGHSAMTHLDCMYLHGGLKGLREQKDLWRWSSSSQTWSCLKSPSGPSKLVGHSAVAYRDSMLLFGGGESQNSPSSCLWRFTITTLSWEKLAVLPDSTPPNKIHHCCTGLGPSFQAKTSTNSHVGMAHQQRNYYKLRPFKNKCFPSSGYPEPDEAIELETFKFKNGKSLPELESCGNCCVKRDAQKTASYLMFENEEAFSNLPECDGLPTGPEESMDNHLPDLLLILGGKPLGDENYISVWQMTLTDW